MAEISLQNRIAVDVDRALCFGFGDCVDSVPAVFALDGEGVAIVIDPDGAPLQQIIDGAQDCPVDAITICGADGAQLYP
ncbi:MAG: hypothetical protein NVS1B9_06830 [Solirubrobacteraceae bacterium]